MPRLSRRLALVALLAGVLTPGAGAAAAPPRLIVLIVVDQLRTEYLDQFRSQWSSGLLRLITEGAWFRRAAYPYLNTVTCAGHATLGTGAIPAVHGMVLNEWWDRQAGKPVTCTEDSAASVVSYGAGRAVGHSSRRLEAPTLADEMRRQLGAGVRVVSLSMKARSALMMGGGAADVTLWFENGSWASPAPRPDSPLPAIGQWIRAHPPEADRTRVWDRALPRERYLHADGPEGKQPLAGWGPSLPHAMDGAASPGAFVTRWEHSPFSDEYLGRLAGHVAAHLALGTGRSSDFLAVSFSALDRIGHRMGPESHEVQDALVRLDRTIGVLLDQLDRQVGRNRYAVALSADHGVGGVPEQQQAAGLDAGRMKSADVIARVEAALARVLGPGKYVARLFYTDLYFAPGVFDRLRANPEAMRAAIDAVLGSRGIGRVFRADQLAHAAASGDPLARAAFNSYFPGRSGDLILVPRPNWIMSNSAATHGTASRHDTEVPVVFYGRGVRPGTYLGPATPADIAPTLAALLGVTLPRATGRPLGQALEAPSHRESAGARPARAIPSGR